MSGQFLHVFIQKNSLLPTEPPAEIFDLALDWYKFSANNWIVWTTSSVDEWYVRIKPHLTETDRVLIAKMDPAARTGWMSKDFWEWFTRLNPENKTPDKPGVSYHVAHQARIEALAQALYGPKCPYCGGRTQPFYEPATGQQHGLQCSICWKLIPDSTK